MLTKETIYNLPSAKSASEKVAENSLQPYQSFSKFISTATIRKARKRWYNIKRLYASH